MCILYVCDKTFEKSGNTCQDVIHISFAIAISVSIRTHYFYHEAKYVDFILADSSLIEIYRLHQ